MSGQAVKISDILLKAARREAELMSRSVARQIEHWAALGQSIEKSGRFSPRKIGEFLEGRMAYDELNALEGTVATDHLIDTLEKPRTWLPLVDSLRRSMIPYSGVVETSGELVRVHPDGRIEKIRGRRSKSDR